MKINGQLNIAKTKEEPVSVPQLLEGYRGFNLYRHT